MVEKTNTVSLAFRSHGTDIEGMDLQDFKDFLGISSTVTERITSACSRIPHTTGRHPFRGGPYVY